MNRNVLGQWKFWLALLGSSLVIASVGLVGGMVRGAPAWGYVTLHAQDTGGNGEFVVEMAANSTTISYQGRLTSLEGEPLEGTHFMRFRIFDAPTDGAMLWDSDSQDVDVASGLFTALLDIDPAFFDGRALWLQLDVNGQVLAPRRPLLAVPYAFGLVPGAMVQGPPREAEGQTLGAILTEDFPDGRALAGYAPATGTALYAQAAGGQGVFAASGSQYGVRGASDTSWGGYFSSNEGYGVVASTDGTKHWDHAGVFQAQSGYGVFAESVGNMAIRGHAGDTTDLWQPVGNVGVVGIGQSRGVYGSSGSSYGIYGTSLNWYGIYGRTSRTDNNYGLYTPHNLFVGGATTASGASMMLVQNGGGETLQPGDLVAASGLGEVAIAGDQPLLYVRKADIGNSHALVGVAYSWYNEAALAEDFEPGHADVKLTRTGPIAPGDLMLVVTHGIAAVNVDALDGTIQAGDALVTGSTQGIAVGAASVDAAAVAAQGVSLDAIGTALEPATGEQSQVRVFVSLR